MPFFDVLMMEMIYGRNLRGKKYSKNAYLLCSYSILMFKQYRIKFHKKIFWSGYQTDSQGEKYKYLFASRMIMHTPARCILSKIGLIHRRWR
jgi:hypothetical protein